MEVWIYMTLGAVATIVPAVGLSLLVRAQIDRSDDQRQPRWIRAKSALTAAVGGAAAIVRAGERRRSAELAPAPDRRAETR